VSDEWDDGDEVARLVREAGIPCHVEDTSGSTATLRVGDATETDDGPVWDVTGGPGFYDRGTSRSTFVVDDMTIGPADDGTNPWIVGALTDRDVADLVVLCWNAPGHIVDCDLLEAHRFDGTARGFPRRAA
jgi:hypothetical protein